MDRYIQYFFFLALGNNLLPHIEANGPEPPASELTEERRGEGHPEFEGGACVGGVPSERISCT